MDLIKEWFEKAKARKKSVILPEHMDDRTYFAAEKIIKEGLSPKVFMIGNPESIAEKAKELGVNISGVEIIDPQKDAAKAEYIEEYYNLRKSKGITKEQAEKTINDPLYYAAMMLRKNRADSVVAGASHTTGDVLRAAIQVVGTASGVKTVSSAFVMVMPDKKWGINGVMFFGDCAVIPNPTSEQLADIAIATATTCRKLTGAEPKVALLSFSTKGSAEHELVDKVRKAVEILKERKVDFEFDGEMQLDAAIIEKVAKSKAPGSPVGGKANCLIFPDLNAGNIGYKLTQRLAGAEALGPVIQGLDKPYNDLSRGCSVDDIVMTAAFAILNAK
ncbi:MAG TPA: phosphate acetyltransferase [Spirochaetota bacterium]|nr:phosphate acetyltransferase [Spirochaetota bacterium]HOM38873.1 phosphate acetyltransferase [Spirochaetota bacterium]HPQ49168.1 phosphate acetyltransferase [Spirochaetota bacterium]